MGGSEASNSGVRDPIDFLASNSLSQPPRSPFSNSRPLNLNLSEEEKLAMSKQIRDIFDSEPANEDQVMGEDEEDEEEYEEVDLEDRQRRTEKLKTVLSPLAQLWWSGSEHIDLVTEKLADGSRESKSNNSQNLSSTYIQNVHSLSTYMEEAWCLSVLRPYSYDMSLPFHFTGTHNESY